MNDFLHGARRRAAASLAVTAALLVPLAVFGGPALAHSASAVHQYGHSSSSQYQYKVTICHHTGSKKHPWHQITISNKAVSAHLRHGDVLPPCPTTPFVKVKDHGNSSNHGNAGATTATTGGTKSHGDNGNHGEGDNGNHGNGNNGHHGKP
jgi:hypothetical protein